MHLGSREVVEWDKSGEAEGLPASHVSSTYFVHFVSFVKSSIPRGFSNSGISMKPVPPCGIRTNRLVIGVETWDPGRNERAPFSARQGSRANQKPSALGGDVY